MSQASAYREVSTSLPLSLPPSMSLSVPSSLPSWLCSHLPACLHVYTCLYPFSKSSLPSLLPNKHPYTRSAAWHNFLGGHLGMGPPGTLHHVIFYNKHNLHTKRILFVSKVSWVTMEENVMLGPEMTTLSYICFRLKIVASSLSTSLSHLKKTPSQSHYVTKLKGPEFQGRSSPLASSLCQCQIPAIDPHQPHNNSKVGWLLFPI